MAITSLLTSPETVNQLDLLEEAGTPKQDAS